MLSKPGLLGDTTDRAYADKLQRFSRFAASEIEQLIDSLGIRAGDRVLDAGCGAGLATAWLARRAQPAGLAVGFDLSSPHAKIARDAAPRATILQADLRYPPVSSTAFDLVWVMNTIHHLEAVEEGLATLSALLRPGGRLAVAQGHFLPEMFFAWDARLERAVTDACHEYYRDKYGLTADAPMATRGLIGAMHDAGLREARARTLVIERQPPLNEADHDYFLNAVFRGYWGPNIQPYLAPEDWEKLQSLCDPDSPQYCLDRPDFHHVQTLTLVTGIL